MHVAISWDPSLFDFRRQLGNPYGGLLVEAMQRYGFTFELFPGRVPTDPSNLKFGPLWVWRNRRRVQVLHLHWLAGVSATPTAREAWLRFAGLALTLTLARLLGMRVVWTLHNMLPHERPHRGVDVAGRWLMAAVANAIICHCRYAARVYARRFKRRRGLHVIPHGTFQDVYPAELSRADARRELGIPDDAFVFVSFGNIRGYKGHDDMLEAFRKLQGDELRLVVAGRRHRWYDGAVGTGPIDDPRVLVAEGRVPIDKLQLYFNAGDVAVFPYREALTSGALITALGFGRPVIATRVGCIPELLGGSDAGQMVPPGDVPAMRAAMHAARTWDIAQRSSAARAIADSLGWDAIARQTTAAYGRPHQG